MAAREGNLVQGEASESDEEYEINQSYFMKNTMVVNEETTPQRKGIVVEGEASESDEEETEDTPGMESSIPEPQTRQDGGKGSTEEQTKRKVKFHYDSSFHRKLRVCNLELRSDIIENKISMYNDANAKLQSAVFYLNRSQAFIQEIFSNVGLISGDLQTITDSLDKALSRDFLPTLKINITETSKLESPVTS